MNNFKVTSELVDKPRVKQFFEDKGIVLELIKTSNENVIFLKAKLVGYTTNDKYYWESRDKFSFVNILKPETLLTQVNLDLSQSTVYRFRFWINKSTTNQEYKDIVLRLAPNSILTQLSSIPYSVSAQDSLNTTLTFKGMYKGLARLTQMYTEDSFNSNLALLDILIRKIVIDYNNYEPEAINTTLIFKGISIRRILVSYNNYEIESVNSTLTFKSLLIKRTLISYNNYQTEEINVNLNLIQLRKIPGGLNGGITCLNFNSSTLDDLNFTQSWSQTGNITISNTVFKVGTGSALFEGTNNSRLVSAAVPRNITSLESNSFTLEFFIRNTPTFNYAGTIFDQRFSQDNKGIYITFSPTNQLNVFLGDSTNSWDILFVNNTILIDTWTHVALTRNGNVFKLYINGVQRYEQNANITLNISNILTIGNNRSSDTPYRGYLDMFRIIAGSAVYTTNFNPDTEIFSPETLGIY